MANRTKVYEHGAAILPAEAWRHLSVPAWTIDLELRAAGNPAGSLTPPSCSHWPLWTGDVDLASHGWLRPAKRRHYVAGFIVTSFSWWTFIYWKNNNTCLMGDAILRIPRDARVRVYRTRDTYDGVVPVTSKRQPYYLSIYIELSGYTPQNHSVPLITRCLNLPHVTSQCNVARDWMRYAPFCFCCASRERKWGPQHHRFITGPPTPPTKRQNGGLLSYIGPWYISSDCTIYRYCQCPL